MAYGDHSDFTERNDLSDRKKMILKAVIDAHIRGGEPVGSKYLTQSAGINLSSATIRNEMSELEDMGYLVQPHASAGRVPSENGYRYYVRSLMRSYQMTMDEIAELNRLTKIKMSELDRIIESAGKLMGNLTNYTAMTFRGKPNSLLVLNFRTMKLNPRLFLLIMVTNADTAQTRHIKTSNEISDLILSRLEQVLNRYVAGVPMTEITLPVIMQMERDMGEEGAPLISSIMKCIYEVTESSGGELRFDGVNRLLQYPEYSDIDKFRGLLGLIEEHKTDLIDVVSHANKDETNVFIGSDIAIQPASSSTLIFKSITKDGRVVGAIGVIGPCRMDYSKVITTVDYLSKSIQNMVGGDMLLPEKEREDKQ